MTSDFHWTSKVSTKMNLCNTVQCESYEHLLFLFSIIITTMEVYALILWLVTFDLYLGQKVNICAKWAVSVSHKPRMSSRFFFSFSSIWNYLLLIISRFVIHSIFIGYYFSGTRYRREATKAMETFSPEVNKAVDDVLLTYRPGKVKVNLLFFLVFDSHWNNVGLFNEGQCKVQVENFK